MEEPRTAIPLGRVDGVYLSISCYTLRRSQRGYSLIQVLSHWTTNRLLSQSSHSLAWHPASNRLELVGADRWLHFFIMEGWGGGAAV